MGPALPCTIVPSDFNQTVGGHCPVSVACTAFAVAETADQVLGAMKIRACRMFANSWCQKSEIGFLWLGSKLQMMLW